jgi:hypothetical protein
MFDGCAYKGSTGIVQRNGAEIQMLKYGTWNEAAGGVGTKGSLVFKTNNGTIDTPDLTERMRVQYDGNVGIGTSSPAYKLDVTGEIRQTGFNFWFSSARIGGDGSGNIDINYNNGSSPSFTWYNGGTSALARITSTGNMGIGTTSPTDKLDVDGAVYIRGGNSLKLDNTSNNYVAQINNGGSSGASTLVFQTGGSARMRIINNGNVGIGIATPSTELEVVGTITCTTLVETSSMSSKTNIKKLTSQTAKIAKLSPVSFNYKINNKCSLGLIAEEVAKVYPELVEYENDRALGVNYSKLTSVLISAVNELAAEVAELKKQLIK